MKTAPRIAEEEKRAAEKALLEIIPKSRHDNDLLHEVWRVPLEHLSELGLKESATIHIAKQNEENIAIIIPAVAKDGYSGDIKMSIGINVDGTVAGVRILAHRETPGLGDKIELNKSNWILRFNGKSLDKPRVENWKVKKDGGEFDQFTGATITPRAVVNRVRKTLEYFATHQELILKAAEDLQAPTTAEPSSQ